MTHFLLLVSFILYTQISFGETPHFLEKENLLFKSNFIESEFGKSILKKHGEWKMENGCLIGTEVESDGHDGSFRATVSKKDSIIIEVEFYFIDSLEFSVAMLGGGQGEVAHLSRTHMWHRVKAGTKKGIPRVHGYKKVNLNPKEKQIMRIEVYQDKMLYAVNNSHYLFVKDESLLADQKSLSICTDHGAVRITSIKAWDAILSTNYSKNNFNTSIKYTLSDHKFLLTDTNEDHHLSFDEFKATANPKIKQTDLKKVFDKKDINKDHKISSTEWGV